MLKLRRLPFTRASLILFPVLVGVWFLAGCGEDPPTQPGDGDRIILDVREGVYNATTAFTYSNCPSDSAFQDTTFDETGVICALDFTSLQDDLERIYPDAAATLRCSVDIDSTGNDYDFVVVCILTIVEDPCVLTFEQINSGTVTDTTVSLFSEAYLKDARGTFPQFDNICLATIASPCTNRVEFNAVFDREDTTGFCGDDAAPGAVLPLIRALVNQ